MRTKIALDRKNVYKGISLWNRENPDFQIRDRLVEQNIFSPFAGVNVVVINFYRDEKIVSSGIIKYLDDKIEDYVDNTQGWVSLLAVDSEVGDPEQLLVKSLKTLEQFLIMKGVKKIRFGGDPQNFLPGLPSPQLDDYLTDLKNMGYKVSSKEYDLYRNIEKFSFERDFLKKDMLSVRRMAKSNENLLYSFIEDNFPGRWLYEAKNIARIPGGIKDYWLLWYNDRPVGFARSNTVDSSYQGPNVNWAADLGNSYTGLGPLGLDSDYRKRGWGLYLIAEVIKKLQNRGYKNMVIDWTTLVDYYKKLGFEPYRKYLTLEKKIK